jgi:hypothetical protein
MSSESASDVAARFHGFFGYKYGNSYIILWFRKNVSNLDVV